MDISRQDMSNWQQQIYKHLSPLFSVLIAYLVTSTDRNRVKGGSPLESPYLTPDNNACENAIRPFVLGRKNRLFSQSPAGAESSCGMLTLIETAKQNGLIPFN